MSESEATTTALMTIISVLTPLSSEERHRTVDAAMLFLGETAKVPERKREIAAERGARGGTGEDYRENIQKWMEKYSVSPEEFDQVFHFRDDGTFDIHGAPGRSKKEQMLNTYILTGLGKFLTTSERTFDDATARGFCDTIGCYDAANHAVHIKNKGPEFSGDKKKGYSLTNVGVSRGAALVKELAGGAAK
jgi:hypothetical protein